MAKKPGHKINRTCESGRRRRLKWLLEATRYKPRCVYCLQTVAYNPATRVMDRAATIDHKIPLSKGGDDRPHNYVLACRACNTLKGDMTFDEFMALIDVEAAA